MKKRLESVRRLYLDANILIYFIEGEAGLRQKTCSIFRFCGERSIRLVSSDITLIECLYGAYEQENPELVAIYKRLLADEGTIETVPVHPEILVEAARLGAKLQLKTIDALHVASALFARCDGLLTNDRKMKTPDGLPLLQLLALQG